MWQIRMRPRAAERGGWMIPKQNASLLEKVSIQHQVPKGPPPLFISPPTINFTMEFCQPVQPLGWNTTNVHSFTSSHCSQNTLALSNTSASECFHLFPYTSTVRPQPWTSQKAAPPWLQYLSQLLAHSTTRASSPGSSSKSLACPGLRIHRTYSPTTKRRFSASRIFKSSSFYRKPRLKGHFLCSK